MSGPKHDDNAQPLDRTTKAVVGSALAVVNYGLFYLVGILLARTLGGESFGDYSVAVAAVTMAATVATLGFEKFALRSVSSYREHGDLGRLHGFLRFSLLMIVLASTVTACVVLACYEAFYQTTDTERRHAFTIAVLCLPVMAIVLHLIEVTTASGGYIWSTLVYRLLLPAVALILVVLGIQFDVSFNAEHATWAYMLAWGVSLIVAGWLTGVLLPGSLLRTPGVYERRIWLKQAAPFMANSVVLTVLNQSSVVIMEMVASNEHSVGVFAAAAQTGSFVVLIATSTNRFYSPQLSVLMERNDAAGIRAMFRRRMKLLAVLGAAFVAVIVVFGRPLLGLYDASFRDGYWTLVVIAISATLSTLFSLSTYHLQFAGRQRLVVGWATAATVVSVGLTAVLARLYGELGAAIGYAIPVIVTFGLMHLFSQREVRRMASRQPDATGHEEEIHG